MLLEKSGEIAPEGMKRLSQSKNLYAVYKEHTLRVKTKIESKEIKSYALQTKHKNAAMTFLMS